MPLEDFFKVQRKRINPFKGLVIDVDTWADAHNYHRDQQGLHAMAMHQHGMAVGLEVLSWDPPDSSVVIYPGLAVDREGNTIIVSEAQRFYLKTEESGIAYITLEYREIPQEPVQSSAEEKTEPMYIMEAYRIEERRQRPDESGLELARIVIEGEGAVIKDATDPLNPGANEIDTRYRLAAGPRPRGYVTLALLAGPGWMRHQEGILNLVNVIDQSTDYRACFKGPVDLAEEIMDLLCMSGSEGFQLTKDEQKVLSNFLGRGGVLLGEACPEGGQEAKEQAKAFRQAFGNLSQRLGGNLRSVERGHPLLKIYHLFSQTPAGLDGPALVTEDQGIIYSDGDYGCLWGGGRGGKPVP
ncbi:MAG: DUF4159 domain-containing protein, partial [Dehalococcoidia bacterium]